MHFISFYGYKEDAPKDIFFLANMLATEDLP